MYLFHPKLCYLIVFLVVQIITTSSHEELIANTIDNNIVKNATEDIDTKNLSAILDVEKQLVSPETDPVMRTINVNNESEANVNNAHVTVASTVNTSDDKVSSSEKTYPKEAVNPDKTSTNATITDKPVNITKYICTQDVEHGPVELVNATRLVDVIKENTSNLSKNGRDKNGKLHPGPCVLVMFYAKWCIFSSQAAPHFNALPRFYPHVKFVAIDAMKYQHFNSHYGIVGVPTLMLIHDGKPVAKFNDSVYSIESFSRFIMHLTTLQPNASVHVTSADFSGPVSSVPVAETDYCLILSWAFITICAMYFTSQSHWWKQFVESVQNTWRESNAQHEHAE